MPILEHNQPLLNTFSELAREGRLPHALLLEGEAGSGKKTCAVLLAQMLLCTGETRQPPCGTCGPCVKLEKGIHPDWRYFAPAPDKKEFTVDLVRQIREEAYISPNEGRYKIYVLGSAQEMNAQAQNALLKTLEEPPAHARFILLCENRARMLETIRSRVTCFTLARTTPEQCAQTLAHLRPEVEADRLTAAALAAAGNIGRALDVLEDKTGGGKLLQDADTLMEALLTKPRYESLKVLAGYEKDRKALLELLALVMELIAKMTVSRYKPGAQPDKYTRFDGAQLAQVVQAIRLARQRASANGSIALLCACMTEDVKSVLDV